MDSMDWMDPASVNWMDWMALLQCYLNGLDPLRTRWTGWCFFNAARVNSWWSGRAIPSTSIEGRDGSPRAPDSCKGFPLFLKHFISQSLQILAFIFKNFSSGSVQFFSCLSNCLLFSFRSSMNLASCRRNYKLCLTRVILQLGL